MKLLKKVGHACPVIPIRASSPLAITPVGANGESAPELAPQQTATVIRNPLIPRFPATVIATGASSAVVAMFPAPIVANPAARKKKDRDHTHISTRQLHALLRHLVERAIHTGLAEQQRHANQDEKQICRKSRRHISNLHPPEENTDDKCKSDGQEPDVDLRHTTDDDGNRKRDNRKHRKTHGPRTLTQTLKIRDRIKTTRGFARIPQMLHTSSRAIRVIREFRGWL